MENLQPAIRADFERIIKTYNPCKEPLGGGLSEYEVLKAHYIISDYFISEGDAVFFGVKNFNL